MKVCYISKLSAIKDKRDIVWNEFCQFFQRFGGNPDYVSYPPYMEYHLLLYRLTYTQYTTTCTIV